MTENNEEIPEAQDEQIEQVEEVPEEEQVEEPAPIPLETQVPARQPARTCRSVALLRITLGVLILVTWYENLQKGVYSGEGIIGLFDYIFNENGGGFAWYRSFVGLTILRVPGAFGVVQMITELLMGLALLFGALTPIAGALATIFFFNLILAYAGGAEWIWIYILLTVSSLVVALTRAGRSLGLDQIWMKRGNKPPLRILW